MKYTWLFLVLTACAPQYSTEAIAQEIRAQYPATTTYSADGISAQGKVRPAPASLYSDGYADGCLAGVGGPQLKRQLDAEYSKGWKSGKRSCKANYDRILKEMTE